MATKNNKGFTLVELIVVIAIIAILAAVSIVGYNQFIEQARDSRAATELDVIVRQLESEYYVDAYEGAVAAPASTGGNYTINEQTFAFISGVFTVTVDGTWPDGQVEANENAFVVALVVAAINNAIEGTPAEAGVVGAAPSEANARLLDDGLYVYYNAGTLSLWYVVQGGVKAITDWVDAVTFAAA